MFAKKIGIFISLFSLVACLAACSGDSEGDLPPEETVAGIIDENHLDGNAVVIASGTPFTEEEISRLIASEAETGVIPDDCRVSDKGYYHIYAKTNCLDYNLLTLPVFRDERLCGEMQLQRKEDGTAEVARIALSDGENPLCELLEANPQSALAMVYAGQSEYAILEDNTVHTIYGYPPQEVSNGENLYNAYNLGDNILSYERLDG